MTTTTHASEHQTFTIAEEITVRASIEQTFASLVAQMGRLNATPDGMPLPMILEPRPGGRWYRDLGTAVHVDRGHFGRASAETCVWMDCSAQPRPQRCGGCKAGAKTSWRCLESHLFERSC
jgi:hypothetical protein